MKASFKRYTMAEAPARSASAPCLLRRFRRKPERHSLLSLCMTFGLMATVVTASAAGRLSYVDLIQRITDLQHLAVLPEAGENCAQCSSYDRRSKYDATTGKYVDWDANGDGGGIIRKEGEQQVLAEMEGPGCIWRIWSATPKNGHVRIYLDGAAEPVVDLPFKGFFDRSNPPFTRASLVHTVSSGWNNYTPIPFQKSCKVVADPGWGNYYHFTFGTFPKDTVVPTFKRELSDEENAALDEADRRLRAAGPSEEAASSSGSIRLAGGKTKSIRLKGPAAIDSLMIKPELTGTAADVDFLRSITLQIRWDGESQPSVWAPLGDFFGTAPGANPYLSLPLGLTSNGWWYCNWYMPFGRSAELTIKQEGKVPAKLSYRIHTKPLAAADAAKLGRFHAKWHRDALLPSEPERHIDWPILKTDGPGRFVGVMLHVWNPRGGWWGEGDEKFFVDGEKFPSTFGTGSEDYFGYAWSSPVKFQHPLHNQTHNDGNSKGHVSVNRWQIPDNVPFHTSFEGCIEKYYPNQRPTLYACMAYWYLATGGRDPYAAVPVAERIGYWTPMVSATVRGAIEGESMKILSKTQGNVEKQDMTGFEGHWSGDTHLWWRDGQPGDRLELSLPVSKTGNYVIKVQMTKAPDYAIIQLLLDGQKLGQALDLYHPSVVASGELPFPAGKLTQGEHKLTIEIVGANERAVKSYMAGLDYVKLEAN